MIQLPLYRKQTMYQNMPMNKKPIVIIGAGCHARVVVEIILMTKKFKPVGCVDPQPENILTRDELPYLGNDSIIANLPDKLLKYAAMGMAGFNNLKRKTLYEYCLYNGFEFPVFKHPGSIVSRTARLGPATVVMAGSIINTRAVIEENVIINSGAIVEHDCLIGHSAQIGPGAVLCGEVAVKEKAFIGAGARIIQGITIGESALIGAGAVVTRDIPAGVTAFGNPAVIVKNPSRGVMAACAG